MSFKFFSFVLAGKLQERQDNEQCCIEHCGLTNPTTGHTWDLQKEMFIFGYRKELRTMRCLQYLYERNTRIYWNRIFRPEDVDETFHYYNTENCIFEEVDDHIDTGDLESCIGAHR